MGQQGSKHSGFAARATLVATLLLGGATSSCANSAAAGQEPAVLDDSLKQYELNRLPEEGVTPLYVDFDGKVQLLGYSGSDSDMAAPGSTVSLTLYWQRTGTLSPGWQLFTHILGERGQQISQQDAAGEVREKVAAGAVALSPSGWKVGKIYADPLSLRIPSGQMIGDKNRPLLQERVSVAVGVWKERSRLEVVSGITDQDHRAIIKSFATGVVKPKPTKAEKPADSPQKQPEKKE